MIFEWYFILFWQLFFFPHVFLRVFFQRSSFNLHCFSGLDAGRAWGKPQNWWNTGQHGSETRDLGRMWKMTGIYGKSSGAKTFFLTLFMKSLTSVWLWENKGIWRADMAIATLSAQSSLKALNSKISEVTSFAPRHFQDENPSCSECANISFALLNSAHPN